MINFNKKKKETTRKKKRILEGNMDMFVILEWERTS